LTASTLLPSGSRQYIALSFLERLKEVSVTPLTTGESDWYESMDAAQSFLPA
jgi:hypothetical protein